MTNLSCRGCGWKLVGLHETALFATDEQKDAWSRQYYCVPCDPNGKRERVAIKAELAEAEYYERKGEQNK